jgi:hypothetical protein
MKLNGLRDEVTVAIEKAVNSLGGYVDLNSVTDTPGEGREEFAVTVVFTEESLRSLCIARSVLQSADNPHTQCCCQCCEDRILNRLHEIKKPAQRPNIAEALASFISRDFKEKGII